MFIKINIVASTPWGTTTRNYKIERRSKYLMNSYTITMRHFWNDIAGGHTKSRKMEVKAPSAAEAVEEVKAAITAHALKNPDMMTRQCGNSVTVYDNNTRQVLDIFYNIEATRQ